MGKDIFFIAEIGINHNGDLEIANKLIDMAKECGCDAVKFQKRTINVVYTPEMLKGYRESPWGNTQRAQKEGLEFGKKEYDAINNYCQQVGIEWFASAWDTESQRFLQQYNLKYNKVASAMLTHWELVEMIATEKKHTFISTGMSGYETTDKVVDIFKKKGCPFTLLHCVSTYPSENEECNVAVVKSLKERYRCPVGYSGHERGILPSILSVVFGAEVIERHITLDRTMYGSDQAASLEKKGLELLVRDARNVNKCVGDGIKRVSDLEKKIVQKLRYHEVK